MENILRAVHYDITFTLKTINKAVSKETRKNKRTREKER